MQINDSEVQKITYILELQIEPDDYANFVYNFNLDQITNTNVNIDSKQKYNNTIKNRTFEQTREGNVD